MDSLQTTLNIDNLLEALSPQYAISSADFRTQYILASEIVLRFSSSAEFRAKRRIPKYATAEIFAKSRYIEGILVGIPQSSLFFDGSDKQWIPIGCKALIDALCQFVDNQFALRGQYFLGGILSNRYFGEMPLQIQEKILNYRFEAVVLNSGVSPYSKFRVYDTLLQLKSDKDYSLLRAKLFPNYSFVSAKSEELLEGLKRYYSNRSSLERIILRIVLNKVLRAGGHLDYPGTVESATNIIISEPASGSIISSIDYTNAINAQSIKGLTLRNQEMQDAFFTYLDMHPLFLNDKNCYHKFQEAWKRMPSQLTYTEYTVSTFLKRLDIITGLL